MDAEETPTPPELWGRMLHELRELRGLSRADVARTTGTSYGHIANIESGRRVPSGALTDELADALDVPAAKLERIRDAVLDTDHESDDVSGSALGAAIAEVMHELGYSAVLNSGNPDFLLRRADGSTVIFDMKQDSTRRGKVPRRLAKTAVPVDPEGHRRNTALLRIAEVLPGLSLQKTELLAAYAAGLAAPASDSAADGRR